VVHQVRCFFAWKRKQLASKTLCLFQQLDDGRSPQKGLLSVVSFVMSCLTCWPLKMGPMGCPETLVRNYHSVLHNILWEGRSHMMIRWISHDDSVMQALVRPCMVLFWAIWFGASFVNLRQPHIFKRQISGKKLALRLSKYGNFCRKKCAIHDVKYKREEKWNIKRKSQYFYAIYKL
jgi:hypothetical protein